LFAGSVLSVAMTKRPPQSLRAASARARREGNGFGHTQVAQIQRARILAAMFDVATEQGAANVSVADVVERSGVSRRTFYETFSDREECFLAAFDDALAFASQRVLPAYQAQRKWRDRIRAATITLLQFLDEEPVVGRLLIVESLTGGAKTLERRAEILEQLVAVVDNGRKQSASALGLPPLTAEGVVGGALSILHARISPDAKPPLLDLANVLVSMVVLPYLGPAAARKEMERTVQVRPGDQRAVRLLEDPFKNTGMRLTYRTVRVLMMVAEHPNASNRTIAESAGIKDQGQISKLLGRLQRLGLIENTGLGPGQGGPNAWTLTDTGRQMAKSVRVHTNNATREQKQTAK
jgi:AcrR family transcriptional regulator/DNA-binding MarR family transcriptional regulator